VQYASQLVAAGADALCVDDLPGFLGARPLAAGRTS
jgi:uroporphyrinogen-III decarboxylase